jgi:DnaJ-class molecular chaperone
MTKAQSDATDFASFKVIKCPKCKGKGHLNGEDCRGCGGYGETQRRFVDRSDDYY